MKGGVEGRLARKPINLSVCWVIAIGLFSGLHNAAAQVAFAPATNYVVGSSPHSVVAVDVNGDGKVALVSANANGNTLTVLTNNGNGAFGLKANYSTYGDPVAVVAADVNGDGKVDLITGNNGTLVVLTNTGNGNFVIASQPGVSSFGSIAAADVNGDGKIDLIEAKDGGLLVLTNGGSGTFSLCSSNILSTTWPGGIAMADVNGDGKQSVVVPDYDSSQGNTLTVLTNDGSGNFGSNTTYVVGQGPFSVIAADVNGDGKVDLISVSVFLGALTVLTNNGSGGFGFNATIKVGPEPTAVAAADVNGDGKLDLLSANYGANTLSVAINNSTFPPPTSRPTLNLKPSGSSILVSWPSSSAGWSLQQNSILTDTNWSPSGYSGYDIVDDGTNKSLTIPTPSGSLFFRMLHP